jgi:HK97 family phage major capsid protein
MTTMSTLNRQFADNAAAGDFLALAVAKACTGPFRGETDLQSHFSRLRPASPRVTKAVIPPIDTTAAPGLATQGAREYAELVARRALRGRIPGARPVPPLTRLTALAEGARASFITEGEMIPVSALAFGALAVLSPATVAVIVPFSEELVRSADPAAFGVIQRDLSRALALAQDDALLDGEAAVPNGRPASILEGVSAKVGGSLEEDVEALVKAVRGGESESPVFITSLSGALYLATARSANGERLFPDVTLLGGELLGAPVLIASAAGSKLIFMDGAALWYADAGVELETATDASFQFSDTPSAGAADMVSLWQANTIAFKAIQYVSWRLADPTAIAYIELAVGSPVV